MIHSIKIKNYLSFKDEVKFTFEATKDKHLEEYQVVEVAPGIRMTKLAVVYGANASGKSNLVKAFAFLREFWFKIPENKDDEINITPFLLDDTSKGNPSEFEFTFYIQGKKYIYTLKLTQSYVLLERLVSYASIRPTEIFTREIKQNLTSIRFNPKLKISSAAKKEIEVKCLTNMSFFAAFNKVNVSLEDLDAIVSWMKLQFLNPVTPSLGLSEFVKKMIIDDSSKKSYILNFLNEADFNINGIKVQLINKELNDAVITDLLKMSLISQNTKDKLEKERAISIKKAFFEHKVSNSKGALAYYDLPEELESAGTLRTMGLSGVLSMVIEENAFLAIDEIESSLHPRLVSYMIECFIKQSNRAQILITTHYDGLLEEDDLFRQDNIWFTNKKEDGSTDLYSLSDFKGVNRISSLQKAYKYGKFGAIPNI